MIESFACGLCFLEMLSNTAISLPVQDGGPFGLSYTPNEILQYIEMSNESKGR